MTYRSLQASHFSIKTSGLNGIRQLQYLQKRNMKQSSGGLKRREINLLNLSTKVKNAKHTHR